MGSCCSKKNGFPESSTAKVSEAYLPSTNQSEAKLISSTPTGQDSHHDPLLRPENHIQSDRPLPTSASECSTDQKSDHNAPPDRNGNQFRAQVFIHPVPKPRVGIQRSNRQALQEIQNDSKFTTQLSTFSYVKAQIADEENHYQPTSEFPSADIRKSLVSFQVSQRDKNKYQSDVYFPISVTKKPRNGNRKKVHPSHNQKNDRFNSVRPSRAVKKRKLHKDQKESSKFSSSLEKNENSVDSIHVSMSPSLLSLQTNNKDDINFIHEKLGIDPMIVNNIVKYLESGNTVPFMARYRSAQTKVANADQLREIKEAYENSKQIDVKHDIDYANKNKENSKILIAERARRLGLENLAQAIIKNEHFDNFREYLDPRTEGLRTEEEVRASVICILVDLIVDDKHVIDMAQNLRRKTVLQIQTKKIENNEVNSQKKPMKNQEKNKSEEKVHKYELYYDWSISEQRIRPHQILAMNRAESKKLISIKLIFPEHFKISLEKFVLGLCPAATKSTLNCSILTEAFRQAYEDLIEPTITKKERFSLSERAEKASIEIFARNLKKLLLYPPVRGKVVLGVDPGFEHGCKMAAVSAHGEVLETFNIFPHPSSRESRKKATDSIIRIVKKYKCEVIALGNGTGCRETEDFFQEIIRAGLLSPVDVTCKIVNESGTSVYSCGAEAKAEFPNMDYTSISAISIARRLQDPLAEYVKVDPKSLGIGMYQHDLSESKLTSALNEVIMEVVSFVGVDVNTASQSLLRRVAGLSDEKAANIVEYRKENGPFLNRQMLKNVKSFDTKTFEQCAGFLRIMPETSINELKKIRSLTGNQIDVTNEPDLLDQTWIHPESYELARKFIEACGVDLRDLGTREFISAVKIFAHEKLTILAKRFKTNRKTLSVIVEGLTMPKGDDIRIRNNVPLYRKSLRCINDLSVGDLLSGEIRNVVLFGVFVDIGVGTDGLIHIGNIKGEILEIGQRVSVKIEKLEKEPNRISLTLIEAH